MLVCSLEPVGGNPAVLEAHLQSGSDVFSGAEVDKALRQVLIPRFELATGSVLLPI